MDEDLILSQLKHETIDTGITLLKSYAIDDDSLNDIVKQVTYGIEIPFHYRRYLNEDYTIINNNKKISINGRKITMEYFWEELDARIALIIKTIRDLQDPDFVEGE